MRAEVGGNGLVAGRVIRRSQHWNLGGVDIQGYHATVATAGQARARRNPTNRPCARWRACPSATLPVQNLIRRTSCEQA